MELLRARARGACVLIIAVAVVRAALADADTGSLEAPLTLRQAIVAALARNPDLAASDYAMQVQEARTRRAGLRPALELSAELENAFGTGDASGFSSAETTVALSQLIELGGKRDRRIGVANAARARAAVEHQAAQLDVLAAVTRRFIEVAVGQEQLALTRQATELAANTAAAVKRRVTAAKSPEVELHRANVELRRAELELHHAEHGLLALRRKLAAMWGDPEPRFESVQADLYGLPKPDGFEMLVAHLQDNPDFLRFASEARVRDAEILLAQSKRAADVTILGGVRRLQEGEDEALVFGLTMPLGVRRRAAPEIDEAEALRRQTDADRTASFVRVRAQLFEIYQELRHAISESEVLADDLLPQMEEALQETQYAFDRGRYSYLELVDGQRAYLDVKRSLIDAAARSQLLQVEIERLTGEPLQSRSNRRLPQ